MTTEVQDKIVVPADADAFVKKNRELVQYLISTCRMLLDAQHHDTFARISGEIARSFEESYALLPPAGGAAPAASSGPQKDPRRQRCLLRLVVGRFSQLFLVDNALFPRSIVEGVDVYLKRSLGEVAYKQLNQDSDELLTTLAAANDQEMWDRIYATTEWRRWADTIFIRILLRFGDWETAKQHMINIVDATTMERSQFAFKLWHFTILFDSMFGDLYRSLAFDDQRHQWEVLFGDGTADGLTQIFQTFSNESLGSLLRYSKISGYQPKFAIKTAG